MKSFSCIFLIALIAISFSCNKDEDQDALTKEGPFEISELAVTGETNTVRFSVNDVLADVAEDRRTANRSMESYGRFTLTLDPAHRAVYTVSGEMFREEW